MQIVYQKCADFLLIENKKFVRIKENGETAECVRTAAKG